VNRTQVFTVTLDRPVPEGGISLNLALSSPDLGSISPTTLLTLPPGATSGQVTFTAGAADATGQLSVSWNGVTFRSNISVTRASIPNHVIISEVAVAGPASANDEFVELYNPTDQDIDITNWKLQYKPGSGGSFNSSVTISPPTGQTTVKIRAHGYFLLAQTGYTRGAGEPAADKTYSFSLSGATGGGHIRIGPNSLTTAVTDANTVDRFTYGGADTPEGQNAPNPPAQPASYERKAGPDSTAASMSSGGADELKGNGQDTDNAFNDFVIRPLRQPQNSTSAVEP
jgi:large repetitive protein